jgi:hypothetical protein
MVSYIAVFSTKLDDIREIFFSQKKQKVNQLTFLPKETKNACLDKKSNNLLFLRRKQKMCQSRFFEGQIRLRKGQNKKAKKIKKRLTFRPNQS